MREASVGPVSDSRAEEARLLEGCLRGENDAWKAVFKNYHPKLVAYIEVISQGGSGEQAEEVAAAVWCALWCGASTHFDRYDPQAGGLLNYFKSLARGEIWRRRRSERSRRFRECKAARNESTRDEVGRGLVLQEFLATLTPREREFCMSILTSVSEFGGREEVSTCNEWKIRSRVMKKFRTYMLQNN
ncbi:MAG: hypothetical protein P4L85_17325 [Paludisphaera borealis]|uniref:RNA polymerase sigma factor n=1 Tax=Paludisphaera borealis TaxID=1387353 RepID=UPI00284D560E|nr:hypothetical protein [Paludisphaera borealis]MDR3621117.1 hypothetical protein [Paludisphaera borealis]